MVESDTAKSVIGTGVSVRAPAKLNLYLHVTAKRDDGYHEIDSLVVFTASGDTVSIQPASTGSGISFIANGPFAQNMGLDRDNLVLQAAVILSHETNGQSMDLTITLTKRLPVAAGIGGGSSDAAATLRALDRYWGLGLSEDRLAELGLELGADVPMCLHRETCFVGGIGEKVSKGPELPPLSLVLINPGVPVATPDVFKARKTTLFSKPARFKGPVKDQVALVALLKERSNDLSEAAISMAPVITEVLQSLDEQPGCLLARMSGSGATCFGLFDDSYTADNARKAIKSAQPAWWVDSMMDF